MKKYIQASCMLLFAGTCFLSCGEKKFECNFREIQPGLQVSVTMREGSYFVYKDSMSGKTDSFSVSRFELGQYCYRDQAYNYADYVMFDSSGAYSRTTALLGQIKVDHSFGMVRYVWLPFKKGESAPRHSSTDTLYSYTLGDYYTNFSVGTKVYDDVYEMFNVRLSPDKQDTFYINTYYSLKEGLVKYRQRLPGGVAEVWELERSNIIR